MSWALAWSPLQHESIKWFEAHGFRQSSERNVTKDINTQKGKDTKRNNDPLIMSFEPVPSTAVLTLKTICCQSSKKKATFGSVLNPFKSGSCSHLWKASLMLIHVELRALLLSLLILTSSLCLPMWHNHAKTNYLKMNYEIWPDSSNYNSF